MEGVRWTNEDDDEEEFIESEEQKESIWDAPEESEEESSWFDSQESESRAEDFLSIVRGEKADEEEESAGDSFMGKLIGEKPEEILEEADAETEQQPDLTSETPVEEPAELSTEFDHTENQELETEQVIEQEPEAEEEPEPGPEQEMEPGAEQTEQETLIEEQEPVEESATEEEPQEEIDSLDDYDSEPDSTNEQEDSARDIGVEEEPEEVVEQEEPEPDEPLEAEETVPAEAEVPIEVDEQVEDGGDDGGGGKEPPEDDHSGQASNNQELTSNDSSGRNSESVNVTHEHAAAGAGLVGVLLGLEHFGRKRADRKLKKQIESNKKEANETDEEFAARMKMIEEEQRIQAQEQDRIDKNQRQADTLRDRHAAEDEEKEVVIQSVTGENFTSENIDKAEEGRERKAGLKLETDIEQSVEEAKMMNQELGGEVGLDSRHESASQRDDGSGLDSDSATSGPTHISEVISTSGINNPGEKDSIINEIIHPPESASEKDAYGHESYMSSVQAGVAIGVIIIIITAVIFFLR